MGKDGCIKVDYEIIESIKHVDNQGWLNAKRSWYEISTNKHVYSVLISNSKGNSGVGMYIDDGGESFIGESIQTIWVSPRKIAQLQYRKIIKNLYQEVYKHSNIESSVVVLNFGAGNKILSFVVYNFFIHNDYMLYLIKDHRIILYSKFIF